ncbi:MBL fold metallo-hydrolase [Candidatus Parcubacteria bacterium]|nr:MBL fold metallo-hydrolase [Candidatus Parcubacteria bacterium]
MTFLRKHLREVVLAVLILANIYVWVSVYGHKPSKLLHVYFLDIGQGDSILIDSPTHGRVLIDGGPNGRVLSELGKILPFGDRRIDVMIESHPDADHISGLVDVVRSYKVGAFLEPGVSSDNQIDDLLIKEVKARNIPDILARRGMAVDFNDGARLLILFPNQDVNAWETNDASIVAKLVYGDKAFLLTGDSAKKTEYLLLNLNKSILKADVLKAGHHGSKNSTSLIYAEAVAPEYGVISAGKDNRYGHPTQEVLDILQKVGAKVVATESAGGLTGLGTIEFETDGTRLILK